MRALVNSFFLAGGIFTAAVAVTAPKPAEADLAALATNFGSGIGAAGSGYLDTIYLTHESTIERGFMVASAN